MTKLRRLFPFLAILIAIVVLYFLFWPVSISPVSWNPPAAPSLTGPYQQNALLAKTERLSAGNDGASAGAGFGPEDVALDSQDRIYTGLDDGRIMRLQADGTRPELFANTHGRPLGLAFDSRGYLIVADAIRFAFNF